MMPEKGWAAKEKKKGGGTHSIADGVLLLSSDDRAAPLGRVQGGVSSHNSLARATAAVGLASNLGNSVPVSHFDDCFFYFLYLVMSRDGRRKWV